MDLELARAAYHEAGHVLAAHLLGGEVREASLESDADDQQGHTAVAWRNLEESERIERSALVALAGPVAERLWRGHDIDEEPGAFAADEDEVEAALLALVPASEREQTLHRWLLEVVAQLRDPAAWELLCRIADALQAHGTLDDAMLAELLP